jgi:hypothetical protein
VTDARLPQDRRGFGVDPGWLHGVGGVIRDASTSAEAEVPSYVEGSRCAVRRGIALADFWHRVNVLNAVMGL